MLTTHGIGMGSLKSGLCNAYGGIEDNILYHAEVDPGIQTNNAKYWTAVNVVDDKCYVSSYAQCTWCIYTYMYITSVHCV